MFFHCNESKDSNRVKVNTALCNRPSRFFPSPSENLASLVPDEIFHFTRPVRGFNGASFTYPAYLIWE